MVTGTPLPRGPFDSTRHLLEHPYAFLADQARTCAEDAFETRILLRRTVCLTGARAVALFYDPDTFQRAGAAPEPLRATLFGEGAIQSTDGPMHRSRKAMFLSLLGEERVGELVGAVRSWWLAAARGWKHKGRVVLYQEMHEVLTRAVCEWAGVPLPEADVQARARDLALLFDRAASKGFGHVRARMARRRCESWITALINDVRKDKSFPDPRSALFRVAWHREEKAAVLPARLAAVELLNLLRPTVAVSVYVTHVAHALHTHPGARARVREGDAGYVAAFVDEVRRYYPFFPAVIAKTKRAFTWRGFAFPKGVDVILDLHGTNHDPRAWGDPLVFRPERFLEGKFDPDAFVPQGGGDPRKGHRCPGEGLARAIMALAAQFLTARLRYVVPKQDLSLDMARLPALPRSGFVLDGVEVVEPVRVEGATAATPGATGAIGATEATSLDAAAETAVLPGAQRGRHRDREKDRDRDSEPTR